MAQNAAFGHDGRKPPGNPEERGVLSALKIVFTALLRGGLCNTSVSSYAQKKAEEGIRCFSFAENRAEPDFRIALLVLQPLGHSLCDIMPALRGKLGQLLPCELCKLVRAPQVHVCFPGVLPYAWAVPQLVAVPRKAFFFLLFSLQKPL